MPKTYDSDVVARIIRSKDGGPLRRILNGRRRGRTGTFISFKADLRAMPWESHSGELAVLQMAEVSTRVATLLAQPHRLEINVQHQREPLIYFPDLEMGVDETFIEDLKRGAAFSLVAGQPTVHVAGREHCRLLVLEIKLPDDPRVADEAYVEKLKLAKTIYARLGIHFMVIDAPRHFCRRDVARFRHIALDRHTSLDHRDFDALREYVRSFPGESSYSSVVNALGGGALGRAKVAALQVRRYLSIDMRSDLTDDSAVLIGR